MATILDQIQDELRNQLEFYPSSDYKNETRPGQPIRVGDTIEFSIDARNHSPLIMKNISSIFVSSRAIEFVDDADKVLGQNMTGLEINELSPGESSHVLENVKAKVLQDFPAMSNQIDILGNISANATASMSDMTFNDSAWLATDIKSA